VKDETGDMLVDCHNILNRWKNYFYQLLNVHSVSGVRQIDVRTAEQLVPRPSRFEVEIAVAKLKKCKSPGSDQIPAELIHKLINSVWNKEELPNLWKEPIFVPVHKMGDKTDCNNYRGISLLSTSYKILSDILLPRLIPYIDEITRDHQCGFRRNRSVTHQIFCIPQILEKKWEYNETVRQLFIAFKKTYDSLRRKVLYSILIEFGVPMKLVRLIRMCLNETYNIALRDKHLSESFPILNGLKQGDALSQLLFNRWD
jgi:hypothetical protein